MWRVNQTTYISLTLYTNNFIYSWAANRVGGFAGNFIVIVVGRDGLNVQSIGSCIFYRMIIPIPAENKMKIKILLDIYSVPQTLNAEPSEIMKI